MEREGWRLHIGSSNEAEGREEAGLAHGSGGSCFGRLTDACCWPLGAVEGREWGVS